MVKIKCFPKAILLLNILFFSIQQNTFSQEKADDEFGVFDRNLLSQNIFEIDTTADAIKLFEKYTASFFYDNGFYIRNKYHIRKKILKKTAFDLGIVTIPYYVGSTNNAESIGEIRAATFNLTERTDLDKKSIFNEKIEKEYYQTKLTFPNIKEGSIIEYEYTVDTPLTVYDKPRTWYFQSRIPTLWSEMDVSIPASFYYKIIRSGFLGLDINKQTKVNIETGFRPQNVIINGAFIEPGLNYRFVVKNAPAFKDESFITTPDDYITKIAFDLAEVNIPGSPSQVYSTKWPDIDKLLFNSENWGKKIRKNNYLDDLVAQLSSGEPKEKLQKAYDYMLKNFKWNEETGVFMRNDLKKVFQNKTGTASELNGIMIALLRALKIETHPVIISTRSHGQINETYPQFDNFNYTIGRSIIDKDTLLIDVTDPFMVVGSLPQRCINGVGRLIKAADEGEMITIKPTEKYTEFELVNLEFSKDLANVSGNYTGSSIGYAGHDLRENFKVNGEESFKTSVKNNYNILNINDIKAENVERIDKEFKLSFSFNKENDTSNADRLYIDPVLFGKIEKNPFTKAKRIFPVNFGHGTSQTILINMAIPEGYIVEDMPKNSSVVLPDNLGRFTYLIKNEESKIQISSKLVLDRPVYDAYMYYHLKDFYDKIVQKHAEQIVLKKK